MPTLQELLSLGLISQDDPAVQNALAQLLPSPQPDPNIAPMQQNSMRFENGPDAGKTVSLDFGQNLSNQARQQFDAQKQLGDPVEYMGRKGRYSLDGRQIVFNDGSRVDVNRDEANRRRAEDLKLASAQQNLDKGALDMEQEREKLNAFKAQRDVREDTTSQAYLQKRFGRPPKDMQWDASGRAVPVAGSATDLQGQTAIETGNDTLRKIDEMIGPRDAKGGLVPGGQAHPGFESAVGMPTFSSGLGLAGLFPGTDTTDFKRRLDEVKGGAFLQAFNTLKGGGQITEVEGKKATDAITRMSTSQSEAEFVKAAQEFRDVVQRGIERAQRGRGETPQVREQVTAAQDKARAVFNARKAIEKGAPRDAVVQRLEAAGITDHGL